jgi:hypothetical protein
MTSDPVAKMGTRSSKRACVPTVIRCFQTQAHIARHAGWILIDADQKYSMPISRGSGFKHVGEGLASLSNLRNIK